MKLGVIARAENRGIGHVTWDLCRNFPVDRILVVDPGRWGQGFPMFPDRYGTERPVITVRWADDRTLPEETVRDWLSGLDAVYTMETTYDPRVYGWAREAGAAVIYHTNPELHRVDEADAATLVWNPTPWRMAELHALHPGKVRHVPVPVALDRFPATNGLYESPPLRVLHVAGHGAYADRNGTKLMGAAGHFLNPDIVHVIVSTQDENVALGPGARRWAGTDDYWRLYEGAHVLAMPRRFGGLCLPIQEAQAAGLAVTGLAVPPADYYGVVGVAARPGSAFPTGSGTVDIPTADPADFAALLSRLAVRPGDVRDRQIRSRETAEARSWEALRELWRKELENACMRRVDN